VRRRFATLILALLVALTAAGSLAAQVDPELLAGMKPWPTPSESTAFCCTRPIRAWLM
jgi:hypothetical protein